MNGSLLWRRGLLAAAVVVLGVGLVSLALDGPSSSGPVRALQLVAIIAGAVAVLALFAGFVATRLGGWRNPESEREFDALVERSERLAREGSWGEGDDELDGEDEEDWDDDLFDADNEEDFKALVRSALDDLPIEFHRALEHVAVVVSDGGRRQRAYGLYHGGTVARDGFADRIIIYRDTLVRDFGDDPDALRAQVTRTVRHELAHHLGWDENGVRRLGL